VICLLLTEKQVQTPKIRKYLKNRYFCTLDVCGKDGYAECAGEPSQQQQLTCQDLQQVACDGFRSQTWHVYTCCDAIPLQTTCHIASDNRTAMRLLRPKYDLLHDNTVTCHLR
jgi:hypothetical protein